MNIVTGYYYMDASTGLVYSIRPTQKAGDQLACQCFVQDAELAEIVSGVEFRKRSLELYATTFKEAFDRWWQENKQRLLSLNRFEISNYVPKRKYVESGKYRRCLEGTF